MKKCPVCSREYRDVVSLCPFDGAGLAPAAATAPPDMVEKPVSMEPPAEFTEPYVRPLEAETAPIVEPVEMFPVSTADMAPETMQFERPPLYEMPDAEMDEAVTQIMAQPPRGAAQTTHLTDPSRPESDPEATYIHSPITIPIEAEPVIPPSPPAQEYRPSAANAASLPYANAYEEGNRPPYNPNVGPVIQPLGAGRPPMPPPRESNPWRWATFGLAGMMLIFAGAWFFLGGSRPGANANDPLAIDPNAANVNPAPPITGLENGLPPPDSNFNSANFNSLAPLPGAGTGPSVTGPTMPFPSGPPPSLGNINSSYPPQVFNSNVPNANAPNFNSAGIKAQPTPLATPKPAATPAVVVPTPAGSPKPAASPKPSASPAAATASPKPSVKPTVTPSVPEPLR